MRLCGLDKKDWVHRYEISSTLREKIMCIENAIFDDPNDPSLWHTLGNLHYDNGSEKKDYCWNMAKKYYKLRIDKFAQDASLYLKDHNHLQKMDVETSDIINEISLRYHNLGSICYDLDQYYDAAENYLKAFEINKKSTDSVYWAASAYYQINQTEKAINTIELYLQHENSADSRYLYALLLWEKHETHNSQKEFWNCIKLCNTKDPESTHLLHKCYWYLGNEELSEKYLRKAIKMEPDNEEWIRDLIEFYEEKGKTKNASKYYKILDKMHKKSSKKMS